MSSTGALSGFVLLGDGTFMIDAFLTAFLTLVAPAEVFRFFLATGGGIFFLRVLIGIL
jgi:hypothetical protein